jgi:ABC-type glycerol-3-phosphate transport system permease component
MKTNTPVATMPLVLTPGTSSCSRSRFRNEYGVQWTAIGAAALIISTPVVLFAVVMQRFLVRGLTMGSVKG